MESTTTIVQHSPLPWEASLHDLIVDANGMGVLEVRRYWLKEDDEGEGVWNDDITRANADYTISAVNAYPALVAALHKLWQQATLHNSIWTPGIADFVLEDAAAALHQAGVDLALGQGERG